MTDAETPQAATDTPGDVPAERPAALDRLDVLLGQWATKATFGAGFLGPGSPETITTGRTGFEWLDGRFFLVQHFVNDHPDMPDGTAIIGLDEDQIFTQHYFDSRGVARVYRVTVDDRELRLWREAPGFSQRFTGVIAEDGTTITGAWEASADGREWRHDFDLTYTKEVR